MYIKQLHVCGGQIIRRQNNVNSTVRHNKEEKRLTQACMPITVKLVTQVA